jgi:bidirectional [NiFe] hydrogenase diaphorase subunit
MAALDLRAIAEKHRSARKPVRIRCCAAAGCLWSGSAKVKESLEAAIARTGLGTRVEVCEVGCMRLCSQGPLIEVDPGGPLYELVRAEEAASVIGALDGGPGAIARRCDPGQPFFARQMAVVLENSGLVEPERIESCIAAGGYEALQQVLQEMSPAEVVEQVTRSGLRGRGGAGYPTGLKWATVAKQPAGRKYVVCNADEGDPGAFMDRSILESDPHRVLEGMAIAAYAVGANQGYMYVRGEYPLAIRRLETAIKQAKQYGLLGSQIFDSTFDFKIDIRIGAGAFVCGEETALVHSIEGLRGVPRPRPPYPAAAGLWDLPTLINNVETFANIPVIIRKGGDWFASIGTQGSKGTKVFALAGKIRNTGLVEVPMGTTLRQIVEEIGGGPPEGSIKAVQTGGPSGGCIPAQHLDTPVDYDSLIGVGSIMGSGGMIVMDQDTDMVDVARFFMEFCMEESCGKCIPCRAGTVQLHRLLERIGLGRGTCADLDQLEALCDMVKHTSLCGLGQSAPNPVLSTLRYFRNEYEALIQGAADGRGGARARDEEPVVSSPPRPIAMASAGCPVSNTPAVRVNDAGQDPHH